MKKNTSRQVSNLYRFIRLILGDKITDTTIAKRWGMDCKNFSELKNMHYPVPRIERLVSLAKILDVDDHLVYEVAKGTPAERIYYLIKELRLEKVKRMSTQEIIRTRKFLAESEQRYKKLFRNASDAIFVADAKTGEIIDCNDKAEQLTGRTRREIIGMHHTHLHPPKQRQYYINRFHRRLIHGKELDFIPARVIRKDGQIIPVFTTANVMELDGRPVIMGIFRDVSRIKTVIVKCIAGREPVVKNSKHLCNKYQG
ncbi:MAG: PAS domain S-box protein [Planctomycetes bacterium]|nr:PAS domain S-box protein [Planctomycetota bacterium]